MKHSSVHTYKHDVSRETSLHTHCDVGSVVNKSIAHAARITCNGSHEKQPHSTVVSSSVSRETISHNKAHPCKKTVYDFRRDHHKNFHKNRLSLQKTVFLVGPPGAGKSTLARKLAFLAGLTCIDLDSYIEQFAMTSIRSIFAQQGEQVFRDIEAELSLIHI